MQSEAFLPTTPDFSLKKSERLCSKKAFEFLFNEGKTINSFPVKAIFAFEKKDVANKIQVAFGTTKKNFKKAVYRNKIKRLLREVYRKNKLKPVEGKNIYIMFLYLSKELPDYSSVEESLIKAIHEINTRIQKIP